MSDEMRAAYIASVITAAGQAQAWDSAQSEIDAIRAARDTPDGECRAPHCWSEYGTPCATCPKEKR